MSQPEPTDRLERLKELLAGAQALVGAERAAFLEAACGDDRSLRAELDSLLAHAAETAFLSASLPAALAERERGEPELRVGPYRLLERLGSGGMGTVWLAVRDEAGFSLRVALKLLRKAPDRELLVPRFLRERRILADLEHPGIARLLDGGTSEDGYPYLALEYVRGTPLDEHARALPLEQRLFLLASIADAVQAAHERGIVHRDLKPSNILVTPEGAPKLLDFGIAKICEEEDAVITQLTGTGERLLTPRYAAPEQIRGEAVSPATDVYALGVLLYEL
ncbi:MAG: serine/threonine protein kinase, partial [Planctomycetes bacterium]|nr:serine/threonine protein kinase [Planctomycetota bacterium]